MEKELGHPLRDGPSPTVEPVPVSPVPASVPDAQNGITYTVESQNDAYVIIREHIDLTHPDCPVVCLGKDARWAITSNMMTRQEFNERYPNNTPHPAHSEKEQERPAPPASGAI